MDIREYVTSQYPERQPTDSELDFFKKNKQVAGYAAPDERVVFNPFGVTVDNANARNSVHFNEALRQVMNKNGSMFDFYVKPEQAETLGSVYQQNPNAMRQSIIARMLAGDPSVGPPTIAQLRAAREFSWTLMQSMGQ